MNPEELALPAESNAEELELPEEEASPPSHLGFPALRRHLLILDLNGLLLDRRRTQNDSSSLGEPDLVYSNGASRYSVFLRPHALNFCCWALSKFHCAVWSSAQLVNVKPLIALLFGDRAVELQFVWGQECCTQGKRPRGGNGKPDFLKELAEVWRRGISTPLTTLLIDDSPSKAVRNPPHTALHPPAFTLEQAGSDVALSETGFLRSLLARAALAPNIPDFVACLGHQEQSCDVCV